MRVTVIFSLCTRTIMPVSFSPIVIWRGGEEEKNEARIFNYGENELPGLENAAAMKADVQMYRCHRCDRFTGV